MASVAQSRSLFPPADESRALVLGPDSLVRQRFGDIRIYAGAGYALLLQVAHPTVGAGVREHSNFRRDPYSRLLRTVDYLNLMVYGGSEAVAVGRRLRQMHGPIRGVKPDGERYSALEPEAYAWVHATLFAAALASHERFIGPLSRNEADRLFGEFMSLGRLLGIREPELPGDLDEFHSYFDAMAAEQLEHTESVDDVLDTLRSPPGRPAEPAPLRRLWPVVRLPASRVVDLSTRGLLPAPLRERFGVGWSNGDERALRVVAKVSRAAGPLLPTWLKQIGPGWLRWREEAIAEGPLGAGSDEAAVGGA